MSVRPRHAPALARAVVLDCRRRDTAPVDHVAAYADRCGIATAKPDRAAAEAEAIAAGSPAIRAEISARAAHVLGQDRAEWWIQARTIGPSAADYVFVKGDMDPG